VTFVGLGPGDPKLCTERGAHRLSEAELVADDSTGTQRLIELARDGKHVVRAVVGDPFESPRNAAEVRDVALAGVPIEVVPGVGWSAAAAAFAGVIADAAAIAPSMVAAAVADKDPGAPVTLIAGVGSPSQNVVVTTCGEAVRHARTLPGESLLVVFAVPEPALRWFERQPLFGKRVLVTRARPQAGGTAVLLRDRGAEPIAIPTIEIRPVRDAAPLELALRRLREGGYDWVAFTSANGVERTWEALAALGADARAFGAARLAAIGPATARALASHGLVADIVAREFRGEGLASDMLDAIRSGASAPRVLLARAARARDVLPEALRAAGCHVDVVPAYETHPPGAETVEALTRELGSGRIDAVLFTSSSTVDNFCDLVGQEAPSLLAALRVASIGPVTSQTAQARGVRVDVTAREYTVVGLVDALAESYA
jgi:uroporphyrinogen III methyltransferase/synthase